MKVSLTVYSPEGECPFSNYTTRPRFEKVNRFVRLVKAVAGGGILTRAALRPSIVVGTQYASGTITLASVLAADTVTLNGAVLTAANGSPTAEQFDMSGTDVVDATSLANAINTTSQSTFINGILRAGTVAAQVTLGGVAAGDTVTLAGVTLRAVAAASGKLDEFSIAGTDTQDATALAALINAHPTLRENFLASSSAAVVTIRLLPFTAQSPLPVFTSSNGSRLLVVAFAATSTVLVVARDKGREGNCMTIATSNAGRLAIGGSATRLLGGTDATQLNF